MAKNSGNVAVLDVEENDGASTPKNSGISAIGGDSPTNGAAPLVNIETPYIATITLTGIVDLLFHRWNCEAVAEKAAAGKNSKAKKTDILADYVYMDKDGNLCLPGEYLRQAVIHAAKSKQDPRSPRKSAMDLHKACITSLTQLAPMFSSSDKTKPMKTWDYEHKCRAVIQRSAITRVRPAVLSGWTASVQLMCQSPEYVSPADLHDTLNKAGKLVGLADFRPSYGRFLVSKFEVGLED